MDVDEDEGGTIISLCDRMFTPEDVEVRVVFEREDDQFEVRFLRLRVWNNNPLLLNYQDYTSYPTIEPKQNIMDLQGIRNPEKHGLMLKIIEEGSMIPRWGVNVGEAGVEKLYYIRKYFKDPNTKVRRANTPVTK